MYIHMYINFIIRSRHIVRMISVAIYVFRGNAASIIGACNTNIEHLFLELIWFNFL